MSKSTLIIVLIVIAFSAGSLISCSQERKPAEKAETSPQSVVQQKGMSDNQASKNLTASDKIHQAKTLLAEAKQDLAQNGKYNCCIKDPCDRCALDHQSCPCAEDLKAGKAVCTDCYAGWQRGDGIVPGVQVSDVKGSFHGHAH